MRDSLVFITTNSDKFREIQGILPHIAQMKMDLLEVQDMDPEVIIKQKIQEALKYHSGPLIVEDTSIGLSCLNGLPGPFIKWFIHSMGFQGLVDLAHKHENPHVSAHCLIGYAENSEKIHIFDERLEGKLVPARGLNRYGWDAVFEPLGHTFTMGEMTEEQVQSLHPRIKAAQKLKLFLKQ